MRQSIYCHRLCNRWKWHVTFVPFQCHFRAISVPSYKRFLDYNRLVGRYRSLSEKQQRFSFELFSDTWRHLKELGQSYISTRSRRTQRTVHTTQTVLVLNCETPKIWDPNWPNIKFYQILNGRNLLHERMEYLFELWDTLKEIADDKMKKIFDRLMTSK